MAERSEPLQRLGYYKIEEKPWTNPLPSRGATGEELGRYWLQLLRHHARQRGLRDAPHPCEGGQVHTLWRYGLKIETKVLESVIALLHEIIAPGASFLCDHECPHVRTGASPDQLRRFLDALDVHQEECKRRGFAGSGTYAEDQREEAEIVRVCRHDVAKIGG